MDELSRPDADTFRTAERIPLTVVLDKLRSAHNVGSIFRTCDAFAAEKIILCGFTPSPPNREIHKTALGATDTVDWHAEDEIISVLKALRENGYRLIALELTDCSIKLQHFIPQKTQKYALVVGNEVYGVSPEALDLCDIALEIPQSGTKHSLNVSVAAGIALWHFYASLAD
jgi:tRNA G18 (ribose-2'-O)-methylase SpoU